MGRIIYDIESLAITFKGDVSFKKIRFNLTESTAINSDGGIFLETKPKKVNQSITIDEQSDKYLVVTVVDMNNVQTIHRFNNDDIQELSWVLLDKQSRTINIDLAKQYIRECFHGVNYEDLGLNPSYKLSSRITIDDVNSYIETRRTDLFEKLSKIEKEN